MSKSIAPVLAVVAAAGVGFYLYRSGAFGGPIAVRTNTTNAPGTYLPNANTAYAQTRAGESGALVGSLVNLASKLPGLGSIFGGSSAVAPMGTVGASSVDGTAFNNPSAYVASANSDGIAYNPVNSPGVTYADLANPDGWGGWGG
jgi:hypothetical protein